MAETDPVAASPPVAHPVLAEVVRSGFVEGRHRGSIVGVGPSGEVTHALGSVGEPMFARSCLKPLQAVGMLEQGLRLRTDLLAVACASHSGQRRHTRRVVEILNSVGLDESALQTPPDWPLEDRVRDGVLRAGGTANPLLMNCSGKHAAMLATCVVNGWSTHDYLDPRHPLQQAVVDAVARLAGPVGPVGADGCGAPLLGTSLTALARAFLGLATADSGPGAEVASAIRGRPDLVSGSRRDERRLLDAVPGAVAKAGAEACYVVAVPGRGAVALKIDDGSPRARPVVMAAALQAWGLLDAPGVDVEAVGATGRHVLSSRGRPVGVVVARL